MPSTSIIPFICLNTVVLLAFAAATASTNVNGTQEGEGNQQQNGSSYGGIPAGYYIASAYAQGYYNASVYAQNLLAAFLVGVAFFGLLALLGCVFGGIWCAPFAFATGFIGSIYATRRGQQLNGHKKEGAGNGGADGKTAI